MGSLIRQAYYGADSPEQQAFALDYVWYLWCGKDSPVFDKDKMATFERYFVDDKTTYQEVKGHYYALRDNEQVCDMILDAFGVQGQFRHIINGHVPVKTIKGENPVKAGGKLMVIDGGFSKAYQPQTGIAGYTLIYNSNCLRLVAHEPFAGRADAIRNNRDIASTTQIFERMDNRQKIAETDIGRQLQEQIDDLMALLAAYRSGAIAEDHKR